MDTQTKMKIAQQESDNAITALLTHGRITAVITEEDFDDLSKEVLDNQSENDDDMPVKKNIIKRTSPRKKSFIASLFSRQKE